MSSEHVVLRSGTVVDGGGVRSRVADVEIADGRIVSVGQRLQTAGAREVDAGGRLVVPGFVDTHSHADAAVFRKDVQRALLRQGVTSIVVGQDGVSYAPGDGVYATEYFAALNGAHPTYRGGGVDALLAGYDGRVAVNVGYLIPSSTIRHEVMGFRADPADAAELAQMRHLVAEGMAEGALGLSTGLDYVPNIYATTEELIELCRPVAAGGGVYVTHMRGGYEHNAQVGTDEIGRIIEATGVSVQISHYHGPSGLLLSLLEDLQSRGGDVTFDAYPYRRGCTLVAMPLLPPELLSGRNDDVATQLFDPAVRARLLSEWFPQVAANPDMGPEWPQNLTFAHISEPRYAWAVGETIEGAAARAGRAPEEFVLDVLAASRLEASGVMKVRDRRPYDDLAKLFTHPAHLAGSDGIYVGAHPHPRAWATFAKFLRLMVRDRGDYTWPDAVSHLGARAAQRFGIGDRGLVRPGCIADLALIDPDAVADGATYETPMTDATGIDDVFVAGTQVLADGGLTGALPGSGLRRDRVVR